MGEKQMKIMSLNVNGFRGIQHTKCTDKFDSDVMSKIIELIKKYLVGTNDIFILQEVPHKIYEGKTYKWKDSLAYEEFLNAFMDFKILKPKHLIDSKQCTVAVCRKDSEWEYSKINYMSYDSKFSYANKFVELECDGTTLLGVHMPVDVEMWNSFFDMLNSLEKPFDFLVGDFNAYVYRGEMRLMPYRIRDYGYENMLGFNLITNYVHKSSIDNIYLNSDFLINQDCISKVINTKLTDHALCILDLI
ncbi:MAG: endonuclease/exonuclease/phosphatase family protein [Clostridiales bacterium]|nr:endonuclease/exonuclease/phosphatase family protein [Clostridiales bacterium]